MRNELSSFNDIAHSFRGDYEKPADFQQNDGPNFQRELVHGRFKEDYMKLKLNNLKNDEPKMKDDKVNLLS